MLTQEELTELFEKTFIDCNTYYEISDKLLSMNENEYTDVLRKRFCSDVLYLVSMGYTKYDNMDFEKNKLVELLLRNIELLPKEAIYYRAVYAYFKHDEKNFLKSVEEMLKRDYEEYRDKINSPEEFANEGLIVDLFFEPFKEAFQGFWKKLSLIIKKYPHQEGLPELCEMIDEYYTCKTDSEAIDVLLDGVQKYPHMVLIKELTAYTYYSMKLWNNAIAYFELIEEKAIFFGFHDIHFMMAWSYGKLKKYKEEEIYYKKSLEENPGFINSLNNLGYSLYKQKRYSDAFVYFEQCLAQDSNYIYAANNYVRALIALGRNKDAKRFLKAGKYKVSKDIQKRVDKLDDTNARLKKDIVKEDIDYAEDTSQDNAIDLGIKRQQFSNEKLLEDELTARIESGVEVFGMNLKMYKRKGLYGRQFIIPIGRLDLLCEDEQGDLYIIELKKDSGYDDAYQQTANYLDWFEQNEISQGKKVYGIICLNSPTKELVEKVHKDKRMKLFEYQISYMEL